MNKTLWIDAINRLIGMANAELGEGTLDPERYQACRIVIEKARDAIYDVNEPVGSEDDTEYDSDGELK